MSTPITSAKITLNYPLYAADFDPQNNAFLLVGGGGGEGRSGVGNKITLLNTSKKDDVSEIVHIDLSRDEDSVTSLAYAQSTDLWATAFAGINSSTADQNAGKNEHLRSFLLEYPPRRRTAPEDAGTEQEKPAEHRGETKALGRVSFFAPDTRVRKETFQRVLRLSKKKKENGPRLGAITTGLAPEGEIVVFAADTSRPGIDDIRGRVHLGKSEEAADVDIIGPDIDDKDGNFRIAYCTDYEIYVGTVNHSYNRKEELKPQFIHGTPRPDAFVSSKARPKFRCIRFLTPNLLLLVQNLPSGKGSELLILESSGIITLRKRLHKKIKSATALSIAALPFSSPSKPIQQAIAIAGADTSITVLTLDHPTSSPNGALKIRSLLFLPSVHPTSITSLTFSTHTPPTTPWIRTPPQYLKLASTSIANTCVVHTLPLTPYPNPPKEKEEVVRYLLDPPSTSSLTQNAYSVTVALFAIALGSFILLAFTEIRGGVPEYIGAKDWLSESWQGWIARPYMFEDGLPQVLTSQARIVSSAAESPFAVISSAIGTPLSAASTAVETPLSAVGSAQQKLGLRDLLAQRNTGSDTTDNANSGSDIIVRHSPAEDGEAALSVETRDADAVVERGVKAKRWEDLDEHEREGWKRRLVKAGQWTVEEGESVLKGVLFSGIAVAVGEGARAVAG